MSAGLAATQKSQASAGHSSLLVTVTIASQLQVSNLIIKFPWCQCGNLKHLHGKLLCAEKIIE